MIPTTTYDLVEASSLTRQDVRVERLVGGQGGGGEVNVGSDGGALDGVLVDTAADAEGTALTPTLAPRVLDDPELHAVLLAPADDGDAVAGRLPLLDASGVHDILHALGGVDAARVHAQGHRR